MTGKNMMRTTVSYCCWAVCWSVRGSRMCWLVLFTHSCSAHPIEGVVVLALNPPFSPSPGHWTGSVLPETAPLRSQASGPC